MVDKIIKSIRSFFCETTGIDEKMLEDYRILNPNVSMSSDYNTEESSEITVEKITTDVINETTSMEENINKESPRLCQKGIVEAVVQDEIASQIGLDKEDVSLERIDVVHQPNRIIQGQNTAEAEQHETMKFEDPGMSEETNSFEHVEEGSIGCVNLVSIINEFDNYRNQIASEEATMVIDLMQQRLISELEKTGCQLINSDTKFCNDRHVPFPLKVIEDGTPIASFKRPGIINNGRIILKAIVTY